MKYNLVIQALSWPIKCQMSEHTRPENTFLHYVRKRTTSEWNWKVIRDSEAGRLGAPFTFTLDLLRSQQQLDQPECIALTVTSLRAYSNHFSLVSSSRTVARYERQPPNIEDITMDDKKKIAILLGDRKEIKKLQKIEMKRQAMLAEVSQYSGTLTDKKTSAKV